MNQDKYNYLAKDTDASGTRPSHSADNGRNIRKLASFAESCLKHNTAVNSSSVSNTLETPGTSFASRYPSSSDDEDLQCVYTYKGGEEPVQQNGRGPSPEITDYLEMDFDPGPSNDQDSENEQSSAPVPNELKEEEIIDDDIVDVEPLEIEPSPEQHHKDAEPIIDSKPQVRMSHPDSEPAIIRERMEDKPCCSKSLPPMTEVYNELLMDSSDEDHSPMNEITGKLNTVFVQDAYTVARLTFLQETVQKQDSSVVYLWDSQEVEQHLFTSSKEFKIIDPACSVCALLNVLVGLRLMKNPDETKKRARFFLSTKRSQYQRSSLRDYLLYRARCDTSPDEFVTQLHEETKTVNDERQFYVRFFDTYPQRKADYETIFKTWLRKGAVPVVMRNVQIRGAISTSSVLHHAWRLNVVYKVDGADVYLTGTNDPVSKTRLARQLSQEPVVYVQRQSVLKRMTRDDSELRKLMRCDDPAWLDENVIGQVVGMIRQRNPPVYDVPFVRIPSPLKCGIMLFAPIDKTDLIREIEREPEFSIEKRLPDIVQKRALLCTGGLSFRDVPKS